MDATAKSSGDRIQLVSSMQSVSNDRCMSFYYHMLGTHVNTLNVYNNSTLIWTRSNNQANIWWKGSVTLKGSTKPYEVVLLALILVQIDFCLIAYSSTKNCYIFQVMFEAVVGESYLGDIALDDITVSAGPCAPSKLCDFEVDRCGYQNDPGSSFALQWYRGRNGTSSVGTGPTRDHTTLNSNGQLASLF